MLATFVCALTPPLLGALVGTTRLRRVVAVALAMVALALPFFAPAVPLLRAMLALTVAFGLARVWELSRVEGLGVRERMFHAAAFVDTLRIRRRPAAPGEVARAALRALAFAPATALGLWLALTATHDLLRWAGGVVFAYALTDCVYAAIWAGYRARGLELPLLHRDPIRARSVGEFWLRWNTTVGSFLQARLHRPLARRGHPVLGFAAAFGASAALHAYFAWVPLGPAMAASMAAFFAAQALLIGLERGLRIARWPRLAAHAWVVGTLLLTSPLFVEPLLRLTCFCASY